jgi:hypothetical protein
MQHVAIATLALNRCGKTGCSSDVKNGMQCSLCLAWLYFKCTGLKETQWNLLATSDMPFTCMSCIFDNQLMEKTKLSKIATAAPEKKSSLNHEKLEFDGSILHKDLAKLNKDFKDVQKEMKESKATLHNVTKELTSLNEYLALSLPTPRAAQEALTISKGAIRETAKLLSDEALRERRIILWGHFEPSKTPSELAKDILEGALSEELRPKIIASWLWSKKLKTTQGLLVLLPSETSTQMVMDNVGSSIAKEGVRMITRDRPLKDRKLRKSVNKLKSTDPKLRANPMVNLSTMKSYSNPPTISADENFVSFASQHSLIGSTPIKPTYAEIVKHRKPADKPQPIENKSSTHTSKNALRDSQNQPKQGRQTNIPRKSNHFRPYPQKKNPPRGRQSKQYPSTIRPKPKTPQFQTDPQFNGQRVNPQIAQLLDKQLGNPLLPLLLIALSGQNWPYGATIPTVQA